MSDRMRRIEDLFARALELDAGGRRELIEEECGDDPGLGREVLSLLEADESAGGFLDRPVASGARAAGHDRTIGGTREERIGAYRLLRKIGQGGMSEVYLAERDDEAYRKHVAIKVVRHDLDREDVVRRFRTERQILAGLQHPNIATLLDGGSTEDGLPFFVMEHIDGVPIDEYCDQNALTVTERLSLFRAVCGAVHFAHQNLVVHRDIKPSNILVTSDGTPKLLDFGIAKLLRPDQFAQRVELTATFAAPMTPRYASPEQVRGGTIGTPSDVYALGVLLYKLLTGHLPYRLEGRPVTELGQLIVSQEPERPSTAIVRSGETAPGDRGREAEITAENVARTRGIQPAQLRRMLTGDLDNIVLMAIRKEPQRRYASAEQLSDDIRRYLEGQPVAARQDTFSYRAGKFVRRNALAVTAAAVVVLLACGSAVALGVAAQRIAEQRDEARRERDHAQQVVALMEEIFSAPDPYQEVKPDISAIEILDRGAERIVSRLDDQPDTKATLLSAIGNVYGNLGQLEKSDKALTSALEIRRGLLDEADPELHDSVRYLATLKGKRGSFDEADPLFVEALALLREHRPDDIATLIETMADHGIVMRFTGRREEAEAIYREALALMDDAGWDGKERTATLNNLGAVMVDLGRFDEAERLFRETLERRRRELGADHPLVAQATSNLGTCLGIQGKYDEAEPFLRESVAIYRRALPEEHPSTVEAVNNLGKLLHRQGRLEEAEMHYQEALRVAYVTLGRENTKVSSFAANLAELQLDRGLYAAAEASAREALEIRRAVYGDRHRDVGSSLGQIGMIKMKSGQADEARPFLAEALEIFEERLPADHWRVGEARNIYGSCLGALGLFEQGESLVVEGWVAVEAGRGPEHPRSASARERAALFYEAWNRPGDAARVRAGSAP